MAAPLIWAVVWIGGRFAIKELAKVTAKQLPKVFAHVKSATKPVLKATNKNPRGVFRADGSLSRASHITPVGQGTPFWNKTFREAAKNPKAATIFSNFKAGMSKKKTIAALVGIGMVPETANLLLEHMDTEYVDPRIPRPENRQDMIDAELGRKPSAPTSQQEFAEQIRAGYREEHQKRVDRQQLDPDEQAPEGFTPTEFRQRIGEDVPWDYRRKAPGISAGYPDLTRSTPEGEEIFQDRMRQKMQNWYGRITAEKAAIRDASPRFTQAELSPYKKVAESGFGQKLFGLRRSKSEIDRDVTYTDLKMQGRDEEADQYWSDWNTENKAKRDAALGGAGSLTEYTRDAPTRGEEDSPAGKTSFAEDIIKKVKKKGGGRVSSRPKSYRTAKVIKQYAKGGSVRKPNRIK